MEDLSNDIIEGDLPPRAKKLRENSKAAARKRIIERGIVHFRADESFMSQLLNVAERMKTPPGTLCRQWVAEKLEKMQNDSSHASRAQSPIVYSDANQEHGKIHSTVLDVCAFQNDDLIWSRLPQSKVVILSSPMTDQLVADVCKRVDERISNLMTELKDAMESIRKQAAVMESTRKTAAKPKSKR